MTPARLQARSSRQEAAVPLSYLEAFIPTYAPRCGAKATFLSNANGDTMHTILLHVTHPEGTAGRIDGFRFLWALYVNGYDSSRHCQPGLKGRRVAEFCTPTALAGVTIRCDRMDRYPFIYVCGVAAGPIAERGARNLHLPLRHAPGEVVEQTTYNGYRFRAEHAALVHVPELPDNFGGLPRAHHRCRNFQFAVAMFGYPSTGSGARVG